MFCGKLLESTIVFFLVNDANASDAFKGTIVAPGRNKDYDFVA